MVSCKNTALGCDFKAIQEPWLQVHERICKGVPTKQGKPKRAPKPFTPRTYAPAFPNCGKACIYTTADELASHKRKHHVRALKFEPTRCTFPGSPVTTVFALFATYRAHLAQYHKFAKNNQNPFTKTSIYSFADFFVSLQADLIIPAILPGATSCGGPYIVKRAAHLTNSTVAAPRQAVRSPGVHKYTRQWSYKV